jgi:hypothetical protein
MSQPTLFDNDLVRLPESGPFPFSNPIHHAKDIETSVAAAAKITESGARDRHARIVLDLVRRHPDSTAIELLEAQVGDERLEEYQIRRRLTDLKAINLVYQSGKRACRVRRSLMATWRAT